MYEGVTIVTWGWCDICHTNKCSTPPETDVPVNNYISDFWYLGGILWLGTPNVECEYVFGHFEGTSEFPTDLWIS